MIALLVRAALARFGRAESCSARTYAATPPSSTLRAPGEKAGTGFSITRRFSV